MKKFLSENWIVIAIGIALMGSMAMAIRNNYIIKNNNILQKQSELVKQQTQQILSSTMHGLDMGVRGYGLTKDQAMLNPYNKAMVETKTIFHKLDSLLQVQNYADRAKLQDVEIEVQNYIDFSKTMVSMIEVDDMNTFNSMLKEDKGYGVWKKYDSFSKPLFEFEDNQNKAALANYNAAIRNNLILQISIIVLALPALLMFVYRVRTERESRHALLKEVEENDRRYVFDAGNTQALTAKQINDISINNSRKASYFIKGLATGNYDVEWEGMTQENESLNEETLAGNLLELREKLRRAKVEDEQRNSTNEGLAQFSEVVRNNQHDSKLLADKCVSFLVNKLKAQQASLFVLEGEDKEAHLRLASCYAYNKKKFVEKSIDLGSGLVGQAFMEGDVVQLKQIPHGYTTITSGLGEATPQHLLIVPLKYDIHTVAVLEMASLDNFESYQVDFLRKSGEFLAAAILSTQTTNKMKYLLDQAMMNEEKMRSSEEEMRQNMEELMATQEELIRKEKEMQKQMSMSS
jgi:CHASE3 domain sensor protein